MKSVGMLTHSYYLRDPRVRREAETLARGGYDVDVVCLGVRGEPRREVVNGVRIYRIPLTHRRDSKVRYVFEYASAMVLFFVWISTLHLFARRYQLVQVHTPPDILAVSALVCRVTGAKVLLDVHDPLPETLATKYTEKVSRWLVRLAEWQERVACRLAHAVITVTEQVRDALVARGAPAQRTAVVMNFADPRIFDRLVARAAAPQAQGGDGRATLVFMGTLTYQYGVDVALEALALVRRRVPEARLKVIGDGEHRPALEERTHSLGLDRAVEFVGMVPIDRIPEVALPAAIGLAPHRRDRLYDMCFPSKIYDYLALGLPVIACRTKSLEYYYGSETLAFFESEDAADLADRIVTLLGDADAVARYREQGARFLAGHNWHHEGRRYLEIVDALMGSAPRRTPERSVSEG